MTELTVKNNVKTLAESGEIGLKCVEDKKLIESVSPSLNISKNQNQIDKTAQVFGQSEEDITKEFKEFKALKLFKRVDCDLTQVRDNLLLKKKIDEAIKYGFGNVIVNSKQIKNAKRFLKGKKIGVLCAVCFPYGEELYSVKKYAVKKAFEEGAEGVYLPLGVSELKDGKIELVKKEICKIVKKYKRKKIYILLEMGEMNFSVAEKVVKILLRTNVSGIVAGSGFSPVKKPFAGASDLHSLSGGKREVVAFSDTEKSREVVNLFSVADRVFLKNASKIALDLKTNLEF